MENQVTKDPLVRINCNDIALQNQVLADHSKTATEYAQMIDRFFPNEIAEAKPHVDVPQLRHEVNNRDCNQFKLRLEADGNDTGTNDDIMVDFEEKRHEIVVNYSIVLFRALFRVHNPDEIYFSKAISINEAGEEKQDIVFKAVRAGKDVYYGDLTDLIP